MGIKFGDNTVKSINFNDLHDVVSDFTKSWYSVDYERDSTYIPTYMAVIKGYSRSCLKKKYIARIADFYTEEENDADIVLVQDVSDDIESGREKVDLAQYGIGDCAGYINEEKQSIVVCLKKNIQSVDTIPYIKKIASVYHLMAPWINKNLLSPKNTSELSLQLKTFAKSLFSPNQKTNQVSSSCNFYKFIESEIRKMIEFPEIQRVLQNTIMSNVEDQRIELIKEYEEKSRQINELIGKIKIFESQMKNCSDKIKNLKDDESELSNDVKAVLSLLDSPNIEIVGVDSGCIKFKTIGLLTIFDPKIYSAVRNRSIAQKYSQDVLSLFDRIFLDRTVTVKMRSEWVWSGRYGIEVDRPGITRADLLPKVGDSAICNPHIVGYGCLGNKTTDIINWNQQKEYDKVLGTILALNSNINCGDGAVFPFFVKCVAEAYEKGNTKIFYHKTDDGWEEGLDEKKDE